MNVAMIRLLTVAKGNDCDAERDFLTSAESSPPKFKVIAPSTLDLRCVRRTLVVFLLTLKGTARDLVTVRIFLYALRILEITN